jgi:hypothetical protein
VATAAAHSTTSTTLLLLPAAAAWPSCLTTTLLLVLLHADALHAAQPLPLPCYWLIIIIVIGAKLAHEGCSAVEAHVQRLSSASSTASHLLQQQPQRVVRRQVIKQAPTSICHGQLTAPLLRLLYISCLASSGSRWRCCCCICCCFLLHCCVVSLATAGPLRGHWAA